MTTTRAAGSAVARNARDPAQGAARHVPRPAHRHRHAAVGDRCAGPIFLLLIFNLIASQAERARELEAAGRRRRLRAGARRVSRAPAGDGVARRPPITTRRSARGDLDVVLVIDDAVRRRRRAGQARHRAARVRPLARSRARVDRAGRVAAARLQPAVGRAAADAARRRRRASPIRCAIETSDLATPQQSGALVLFLVAYYGLFASVMGGMAVALDTTAGERERQSLEPLLMTPARPARDRRRQMARRVRVQCARRAADADRLLPDAAVRAAAAGRRAVPVRRARVRPLRCSCSCR